MKNVKMLKRALTTLVTCSLLFTGIGTAAAKSQEPEVKTAAVSSGEAYVYYVSNSALYRVKSDGTDSQRLLKSFNFRGVELKPAGNYLYFSYDESSTTLLRVPADGSANLPKRFYDDAVYYTVDNGFLYYMNSKGAIYRADANANDSKEAKLVADMADVNFSGFIVKDGRIYYNARKSGRTTWVASKAADGSGQVQWIAQGALPDPWYSRTDATNLYLIVNTKPEETQYSVNCMVMYVVPKKGGAAKALNPKNPIDTNAVHSGWWANGYYMFNKDIRLGSDDDFDYTMGKGTLLKTDGTVIPLHKTGIYELANVGTDKLVFVDANGKAYASTIQNNKVTSTKALSINNVGYVRNLLTDGKVRATMLFAESGAYMLKSDLTLQKMVGIEWDLCMYQDDVNGFFYVNAGDNGRLYRMNDDGKTSTKLSEEKVDKIVLIDKL